MNIDTALRRFAKTAVVPAALFAICAPAQAVPITYSGYDPGAGAPGAAPNSSAAAAAFDAAVGATTIVDFESPVTPGFSVSGDGFRRNSQRCAPHLCGYNRTAGGRWFLDVSFRTTFSFEAPISAFGAYFTGVQRGDATLTYADGATVVLTMPEAILRRGGTTFFGFSDAGASIVSIDYFTGTGGDFVGVDDIRYRSATGGGSPVSEPATFGLLGLGLIGFAMIRRRRT